MKKQTLKKGRKEFKNVLRMIADLDDDDNYLPNLLKVLEVDENSTSEIVEDLYREYLLWNENLEEILEIINKYENRFQNIQHYSTAYRMVYYYRYDMKKFEELEKNLHLIKIQY